MALWSFDDVYVTEYASVVRLGVKLTGSLAVAEDIAQEAFARAHARWSVVGAYERPGAWVRRVAINLSRSRARSLRRRAVALVRLRADVSEAQDLPVDDWSDLWSAVRRLPRRQAQVVALYSDNGCALDGIAEVLGCSESTVRVHLHRARTTLARQLAGDAGAKEPT